MGTERRAVTCKGHDGRTIDTANIGRKRDPEPAASLAKNLNAGKSGIYSGVDVTCDDDKLVSLGEMWKAAGSPANKDPRQCARLPQAASFIENVARSLNVGESHIWKSRRGKHLSGTWAHWQIALAYAKHLSHGFRRHWARARSPAAVCGAVAAARRSASTDADV